jgi:hypothetical protein
MNEEYFYEVIKDKVIDWSEIVINLFEHCNMSCVFCPQDHSNKTGLSREAILRKVGPVVDYINKNPYKEFHLHIMGGELFQDELINQGYIEIYSEFIDQIKQHVSTDKKLLFNFITNLVYENVDAVISFANKHNLKLTISYDLAGRFNAAQFDLYKINVEKFKPYIKYVSLVITKQNITKLLQGDPYHDYLYDNFTMTWDHLLPGHNSLKVMMPSESELYSFYTTLIDKYPNTVNVEAFVGSAPNNKMSCTRGSSFTILFDDTIPKGCSGSVLMRNNSTKDLESTIIIQKFIKERDCFGCEYYQKCGFSCFIRSDYKDLVRDLDDCVFRKSFKYFELKLEK